MTVDGGSAGSQCSTVTAVARATVTGGFGAVDFQASRRWRGAMDACDTRRRHACPDDSVRETETCTETGGRRKREEMNADQQTPRTFASSTDVRTAA